MDARLETVEAEMEKLLPQLDSIFAKYAAEEAAESELAAIHECGYMRDYYIMFQMKLVGIAVATQAISSGMVEDVSSGGGVSSHVLAGCRG